MENHKEIVEENEEIAHLGCPAYPNCDIDPNGCLRETPLDEIEFYGHKD